MAWWTGKTAIAAASIGDSNAFASGGVTPPGGQTNNPHLHCYVSEFGQVPYDEANLGWYSVDPNGTARAAELASYSSGGNVGFVGQYLGGNGNAAMQMGSTFQQGSDAEDVYLYQCAAGGTTADFWANGDGWDTLLRTIPTALAAIPGSPTYFDILYISLGTNDCIQDYTADQFLANIRILRDKMIAEGWWVPNTTRVVWMDLPRNGTVSGTGGDYPDTWFGIDYILARLNDRIAMINSIGMTYDTFFPVHYLPPSYTSMGLRTGELLLADIPVQQSVFSVGGTRLSIGGQKIRVNSNA